MNRINKDILDILRCQRYLVDEYKIEIINSNENFKLRTSNKNMTTYDCIDTLFLSTILLVNKYDKITEEEKELFKSYLGLLNQML